MFFAANTMHQGAVFILLHTSVANKLRSEPTEAPTRIEVLLKCMHWKYLRYGVCTETVCRERFRENRGILTSCWILIEPTLLRALAETRRFYL